MAYSLKYNRECENQVALLMITNGEKWHYLALKSMPTVDGYNRPIRGLSRSFRGITSNHNGDFYRMGCLTSFHRANALKKRERLCGSNDYCYITMPEKGKHILKYLPGEKSLKAPFVIYADFECSLIKEQSCQNNLEKSYTEKKAKHETSGCSLSLICSFDEAKNKHYLYRGKDCIENFYKKLKELGTEITS